MSTVSGQPFNCELHGDIHYLYHLGVPICEIHCRSCTMYEENNVFKVCTAYYWVDQFAKGKTNLHKGERSGQPSDAVNDKTINIVWALSAKVRRYVFDDMRYKIETEYPSSQSSIFRIHTAE